MATKIKIWHVILVAAMCLVIGWAAVTYIPALDISDHGKGNTNPTQAPNSEVTRKVSFAVTDYFNGSAPSGTLYIYKSGTDIAYETLTVTSGAVTSSKTYSSGQVLDIKFDDGSNGKIWTTAVTVPTLSSGDADSGQYPQINLDSFTIGTYATDSLKAGSTSINDAGSYNNTLSGNTPIFKYELDNTGASNTGLMTSHDPTTDMDWGAWVVVKISGTGSETVNIASAGFDRTFWVGTTQYGLLELNANSLTTWKDSLGAYKYNEGVKCSGTQTVSFTPDMSGMVGTAITMQITAYMYIDPTYMQTHSGAVGSQAVQIAEQTVTLTN